MDKAFRCRVCAKHEVEGGGYATHARAFLYRGELEYSCLVCGGLLVIAHKPCDHKWKLLKYSANEEGSEIAISRQCTECERKQHKWVQVGWPGDDNVNE